MKIKSGVAWGLLAIAVLCGLFGLRAQAQVVTPFTSRFSTNDTGDIVIVGNTLMTCPASAASCISAQTGIAEGAIANDNYYDMVYVDVDNDPTTFNSSRANLSLPSGGHRTVGRAVLGR